LIRLVLIEGSPQCLVCRCTLSCVITVSLRSSPPSKQRHTSWNSLLWTLFWFFWLILSFRGPHCLHLEQFRTHNANLTPVNTFSFSLAHARSSSPTPSLSLSLLYHTQRVENLLSVFLSFRSSMQNPVVIYFQFLFLSYVFFSYCLSDKRLFVYLLFHSHSFLLHNG
jgi:hypothetical protein